MRILPPRWHKTLLQWELWQKKFSIFTKVFLFRNLRDDKKIKIKMCVLVICYRKIKKLIHVHVLGKCYSITKITVLSFHPRRWLSAGSKWVLQFLQVCRVKLVWSLKLEEHRRELWEMERERLRERKSHEMYVVCFVENVFYKKNLFIFIIFI